MSYSGRQIFQNRQQFNRSTGELIGSKEENTEFVGIGQSPDPNYIPPIEGGDCEEPFSTLSNCNVSVNSFEYLRREFYKNGSRVSFFNFHIIEVDNPSGSIRRYYYKKGPNDPGDFIDTYIPNETIIDLSRFNTANSMSEVLNSLALINVPDYDDAQTLKNVLSNYQRDKDNFRFIQSEPQCPYVNPTSGLQGIYFYPQAPFRRWVKFNASFPVTKIDIYHDQYFRYSFEIDPQIDSYSGFYTGILDFEKENIRELSPTSYEAEQNMFNLIGIVNDDPNITNSVINFTQLYPSPNKFTGEIPGNDGTFVSEFSINFLFTDFSDDVPGVKTKGFNRYIRFVSLFKLDKIKVAICDQVGQCHNYSADPSERNHSYQFDVSVVGKDDFGYYSGILDFKNVLEGSYFSLFTTFSDNDIRDHATLNKTRIYHNTSIPEVETKIWDFEVNPNYIVTPSSIN